MEPMSEVIRSWRLPTLLFAIFLQVVGTISHAAGKPIPSPLELPPTIIGTWQVNEVHIDTGATRTIQYQDNDPRLIGRLFVIGRDKLTTNTPEDKLCIDPKVSATYTTAALLVKNSMAGRVMPAATPTPKDYKLPFPGNALVEAFTVKCQDALLAAGLGRDDGMSGAWIVVVGKEKLAIRWYDETILILTRVAEDAQPGASFKCERAVSSVEKTICGSIALAAFDRSVAQSYAFAVRRYKDVQNQGAINRLKMEQKAWISKRNGCGTDSACLEKSMTDRLQAIETMAQQE